MGDLGGAPPRLESPRRHYDVRRVERDGRLAPDESGGRARWPPRLSERPPGGRAAGERCAWARSLCRWSFDAIPVLDGGAAHGVEGGGDPLLVGAAQGAGQGGLA